jgi:hypothetical protein
MTKPIYLIGVCALVMSAAIFVWLQDAVSSQRDHTGSVPKQGSLLAAEAAPTSPTLSQMMFNLNRPLPVEQWDAF